jgi:hypothetical protein
MQTVKEPMAATIAAQMVQERFTNFQVNNQIVGLFTARSGESMTPSASMDTLKEAGYKALTYQQAFVAINANPQLKKALLGKWFYLEGTGTQLSGYYTVGQDGNLTEGKAGQENTAYVYRGNQPLSLDVRSDHYARLDVRRFLLLGSFSPDFAAPVVLGFKLAESSQSGKDNAAQKIVVLKGITPEDLQEAKAEVARINAINPRLASTLEKVVRAAEE